MLKRDVVYILANNMKDTKELRYSLRSLVNFPHDRVWFFGGLPDGFKPDRRRQFTQVGATKWDRVTESIRRVCMTDQVSEDFWLFNDDFFIIRPVTEDFVYHRGTIAEHAKQLYRTHGFHSNYENRVLIQVKDALEAAGLTTYDYTLHIPMLINKTKALEAMDKFPGLAGFRNLYGNYAGVVGEKMQDVKITDINRLPSDTWQFMSTSDAAFLSGGAGAWCWQHFKTPSKWEPKE